ncbi:MAG TPA: GAF domain-containing protein, partial [Gaiellaceae bacterium]|nr:GAF domain-containing protein [Gaiellaceae bacterium]
RDVSEREELRSRLRDLDAVYRFADAVAGASELHEVLEAALDALLEATGADRASVLLADEDGALRFRAWRGLSDRYRAYTEGRSPWLSDVSDPQPVLVEDVADAEFEPALQRVMRKEGVAALAFVPLVRGGRQLGRFVLYRDAPHEWSDREVLLSRTVANHLASVIERAQVQHEAEASRARLALLLEATEQLTQTLDYEELLRRVPQLVVPRIADGCHVYIAQNEETELARVAHAHVEPRISALLDEIDAVYDVARHRRIPVVEVFRTGKPIHQPALTRPLKKVTRPGEEELVRMESRSLVVVPLEASGKRLGVLVVTSSEPGRHGDEDFELVSELAKRVSLALDLVGLHHRAQDSLAQLQAVIAQLPLGVAITDAHHRIILRNDELEHVWGAPVAVGYDHRASDVDTAGWPLERAVETGEVTIGERHEVERDAETRTLEISAAPVRDDDGAIVSAVAILSDVTRRSRAEENLRFLAQANELLVASLDWERTLAAVAELAVPALAGYLVIDLLDEEDELHWVVAVHADPEKTELVRELRGQYPPTVSTHPIQVALRTAEPVLLPDLQAEAEAMSHDAKHARAIRRIANTSGLVAPLIARGRTLGTISLGTIEGQPRFDESDLAMGMELARRISLALDNARLFSEAQERAHAAEALEYVDDGVILVDEAGIVRLWNPTAAISLRRPAVEAVGRPIAELLGDWQSLQSRIPVASEPQAGGASRQQTLPVEVQGEERWLSISAVRFPAGTVYAFRDVTDERAVEQMKTDFVSTVSHELRTPLAAIYGAAMTLRRRDVAVEESQRDRLLEVVSSEADRLARIVNDILWASRLESGRMSIAIERCDAGAITEEVADVLRSRAPEGIEVAVSRSRGLPQVAADPDKLRQILT